MIGAEFACTECNLQLSGRDRFPMSVGPRSTSTVRLLIVDADVSSRRVMRKALEARIARPMLILETAERDAARVMAGKQTFDVVAIDLDTIGGPAAFRAFTEHLGPTTLYALGDPSDVQAAVACVRAGAADFIEKPVDGNAFARRVERQFVESIAGSVDEADGLIGASAATRALSDQVLRVAPSLGPVFISGEAGSGKSLVARAVHARSRRRTGPFVTLDCATTPTEKLVADLSEPDGALTGADGGTLFLDEVGHLADAAQLALMRFLDTGEIAGLDGGRRLSVRVIASSRRPLDELSGPSGLRQDLYFRLNVLTLAVPPLRERSEDIPALVDVMVRQINRDSGSRYTRFTAAAVQCLGGRSWPGNVAELRSALEKLMALYPGDLVTADMVVPIIAMPAVPTPAPRRKLPADVKPLWMEEARVIEEAIAAFDGNIAKAAAALEISPSTIYRKRRDIEEALALRTA